MDGEFHFAQARLASRQEIENGLHRLRNAEEMAARKTGKSLDEMAHSPDPSYLSALKEAIRERFGAADGMGRAIVEAIERAEKATKVRGSR